MTKVIVVVGPTGVGKTRMGVALAKQFNGEVISGDSMQIYKGMDIGTAKVTQTEMQGIVHHCIDLLEPYETYRIILSMKRMIITKLFVKNINIYLMMNSISI